MRTKTINLFKLDELDDRAKERARDWYRQAALDYEWWDGVYEDAKNVGLKIAAFDLGRSQSLEANFITSPLDTVEKILKDHGESCETYKTAKEFEKELRAAYDATQTDETTLEDDDTYEAVAKELLYQLRQDYWRMLEREQDYLMSAEAVDESIRANDYEFTENGEVAI